ncbi:flavoprotein [Tumebacillus sp. ITR2]|uniref:Flavoprotein n=1 Tax=Tumebacillus amylolyticus TaxID=2801339 RepID=A0ABS1J6D0_9BACL|nr:flavoprotein [Tumebacillus amylolyticus]MBL0385836.1 flavoprotein [Tumebacillus amylolyticus]
MKLLIGVTGSSGVMEIPLYLRVFREKLNAQIKLVVSPSVKNFVNPNFLAKYVNGELYEDMHVGHGDIITPHSDLSNWADLYIVLPCTANTLSKAAAGAASDLISMLILVYRKPVVFFPNMSPWMWEKASTQRNVKTLLEDGHRVVQPSGNGWITATGIPQESGHMPPPQATAEYLLKYFEALQARENS